MSDFRQHLCFVLASVIVTAAACFLLGGWVALLGGLCVLFLLWLISYWYHLAKLMRWLRSPKLRTVPHGIGIWENIFTTLLRQAKSRKKRKQKLGMALQRFNRAVEAMPNGVLILGKDGSIQWMNTLAAAHLNLDLTLDRGRILSDLIRAPEWHRFLLNPLTEPVELKFSLPHTKGLSRTLNLMRVPFENDAELLITQDITAAEQLDATRTAFVANVSHELRTPLTVINGFLETLADTPDLPPSKNLEFIRLMQREGQRMHQLLADLLTLSRLENQVAGQLRKEPIHLSALVQQLVQEAQSLSQQQHQFVSHIDDAIWVEGMPLDLYNALSNLVFNAVRYTPAGGEIRIELHSKVDKQSGMQAVFSVADTGPGIAPVHLPHLTERFYRVDPGRSRQSGGTGLGLAISKHALAEHDGELLIDSTVGVGSTFTALMPQIAAPVSLPAKLEVNDAVAKYMHIPK